MYGLASLVSAFSVIFCRLYSIAQATLTLVLRSTQTQHLNVIQMLWHSRLYPSFGRGKGGVAGNTV